MEVRISALAASLLICNFSAAADIVVPTLATLRPMTRDLSLIQNPALGHVTSTPERAVVSELAERCQTGTLLFSRGDCLAVKACTGSQFTHVATTVRDGGQLWVYDSTAGVGVRKLSLEKYLEVQAPDEVTLMSPIRALTAEETAIFQRYLEEELGRSYGYMHFVTGWENDGIHCAECMTEALMTIGWLTARKPGCVSPASLLEGIADSGVYLSGEAYVLKQSLVPIPEVEGWCEELWQDTKLCCLGSCRQLSRWFLCR